LFPYQQFIADYLFKHLLVFIANTFFRIHIANPQIASDTSLLYLLVLLLLLFSIALLAILSFNKLWKKHCLSFIPLFHRILFYYLALQLLKYGADKIGKAQFYLPEPNILYTPFGKLDKDILYWSCMGTSYGYNLFLGVMEVLAAVCLLARRLRVIGLLLATGILTNVVAINFCFDISVKVYSCFLLFLCLLLLPTQLRLLYNFLILKKDIRETHLNIKYKVTMGIVKTGIICVIFLEAFYLNISSNNYNDDIVARPYLHGAYQTMFVLSGTDTLPLYQFPIKRFFIHRRGYIIFQGQDDDIQDYHLDIDSNNHIFILTNYQLKQTKILYAYANKDSLLTLQYHTNGKDYTLEAKALLWQKLPVLQRQFHWTIDDE
jgi:hypothetical protein